MLAFDAVVLAQCLFELVRRLDSRRVCGVCGANADPFGPTINRCQKCGGEFVQRPDDNREVVIERLKIYERQTYPLVEYYQGRPTFRVVNGAQTPDRVRDALSAAVSSALGTPAAGQKSATAVRPESNA